MNWENSHILHIFELKSVLDYEVKGFQSLRILRFREYEV